MPAPKEPQWQEEPKVKTPPPEKPKLAVEQVKPEPEKAEPPKPKLSPEKAKEAEARDNTQREIDQIQKKMSQIEADAGGVSNVQYPSEYWRLRDRLIHLKNP